MLDNAILTLYFFKMAASVVLIDDFGLFREMLQTLLITDGRWLVAGVAANGPDGIELVLRTRPNLIILDLNLPVLSGFEIVEIVRRKIPGQAILIFSAFSDAFTVYRVEQCGVNGFLCKGEASFPTVVGAIETILSGRRYFSRQFLTQQQDRHRDPVAFDKILSPQEINILTKVSALLNDDEIAVQLKISTKTVIKHRFNIARKLNVHHRLELERFGRINGFQSFLA